MSPATKISHVSTKPAASAKINQEETPFEALASICSVLVVGLFILTFLAQGAPGETLRLKCLLA